MLRHISFVITVTQDQSNGSKSEKTDLYYFKSKMLYRFENSNSK